MERLEIKKRPRPAPEIVEEATIGGMNEGTSGALKPLKGRGRAVEKVKGAAE